MAIGQRIRFFRKRNNLTKKQLKKKLGISPKKSNFRISQYESETKLPKQKFIKKLAAIFNISTNALTVPNIDSDIGLIHTFFALEDMYRFKAIENDGEIYLHLASSVSAPGSLLNTMLHAWQQQTSHLENGTISKEDYDEWRYQYSEPTPSQHMLKLSSPEVDDTSASFDETYYLVDFENVHEDGLSAPENLGSHDHIYLFSTKNAPKISIQTLTGFNAAHLHLYEIPAGNQSLDMHLVSYLGYLIGKNTDKKCKYTIVSKDTDYDNLITFWKDKNGSQITRQDKICKTEQKSVQKNIQSKTTASKTNKNKKTNTTPKTATSVKRNNKVTANSQNKTLLNTKVQQELSKAGYSGAIINEVASIVVNNYGKENAKQTIYRTIVAKYGQKQGLNIYNHIKKLI